jgi:hypothetical protein
MALDPHSEKQDLAVPADYREHHPNEHPSDWGWHGEWGRWSRVAGWVVVVILLLMTTATHYNDSGTAWLVGGALVLAGMLLWDHRRSRNAWRK